MLHAKDKGSLPSFPGGCNHCHKKAKHVECHIKAELVRKSMRLAFTSDDSIRQSVQLIELNFYLKR